MEFLEFREPFSAWSHCGRPALLTCIGDLGLPGNGLGRRCLLLGACTTRFAPRPGARVVGGLLYSVGAVLNLLHWPALWPGTFGPHELFHLFVLASSLAHYLFILEVVVPFVHRPPEVLDETIHII
jgi:hypothetical protein